MSYLEPAVSDLRFVCLLPGLMPLSPLGESLDALKIGCFKYFECGGDCDAGPVGLLSECAIVHST